MAAPKDLAALARYKETLSYWAFEGYIQWKSIARRWLDENLPGYTTAGINELMYLHVSQGGQVEQTVERRPEYVAYRFHYDLRLPIDDRRIHIETVLIEDDRPDPTIRVVSIHDA